MSQDDVQGWREALREAASISGVVVLNSRNESEAIKNIVANVSRLNIALSLALELFLINQLYVKDENALIPNLALVMIVVGEESAEGGTYFGGKTKGIHKPSFYMQITSCWR
ncbi:TMV resistance protein N isoform X1 [Spatholobus suberectus]|nr:TMV resistance protein N isoform X1 [Spatholobus suberectus]